MRVYLPKILTRFVYEGHGIKVKFPAVKTKIAGGRPLIKRHNFVFDTRVATLPQLPRQFKGTTVYLTTGASGLYLNV